MAKDAGASGRRSSAERMNEKELLKALMNIMEIAVQCTNL